MSAEIIANFLLPSLLAIVMLGLGLSLSIDDFKNVVKFPKAFLVGFVCHMLCLPILAFGLCYLFGLSPYASIGLVLIAASPAGATSNLFTKLAGGDVALSISLTAINTCLGIVTLPFFANFAISHFMAGDSSLTIPASKMLILASLVVVPVGFGMLTSLYAKNVANKIDKPIGVFSLVFLAVIIVGAVAKEYNVLSKAVFEVGPVVVFFAAMNIVVGYGLGKLARVNEKQCISLVYEFTLHNGSISLFVALSVLSSMEIAAPVGLYSIFMYFPLSALAFYFSRRENKAGAVAPPVSQKKAS